MGNIFDYLEWRCDIPFDADPFNEVDNLVLAELAYTDFRGILSMDGREISLQEACEAFFRHHTHEEILASKSFTARAPLLMEKMLCGARYRDIRLCRFLDETESARDMQLAAVTILLPDQTAYIAFRGTDGTLVGWKEDFNLSFLPETEGQRRAIQYLNRVGRDLPGSLRVGGHSKGGNLAVYAAAFCERDVQDRVLAVYSNDGPGFQEETLLTEGLDRFFLLAYAKRKQYQFNEYRKYKYRKKIVAVDYLTTHFKHPANRLVNNIHSVFPSQLFIGSFIVFLGVFLHTPLVFGYLFERAPALFFGNGIIAPFPKGIAAKYSPYGKPESNEKASFLKCLNGIG